MRVRAPYFTASMTTWAHELRGRRIGGDKRVHGVLDEVRRTNLKGECHCAFVQDILGGIRGWELDGVDLGTSA